MKKTSFLKKLTAMAATLAMTCVMAVGAFAAEPTVDYKLDSASIHVGETWTMEVPAGNIYDWNLSSRSEERRVGKECRSRWSPYH